MEQLWAPWRIEYILKDKSEECVLCQKPAEVQDEANYILYRGERNFVMLNAWPYNPGHLMVAPYRHVGGVEGLSDEELWEHGKIVRECLRVLRTILEPAGFNLGINTGKVAGAGIEGHIHTHIVPRWEGDTNFVPVISNTSVLPEALSATYQRLKGQIFQGNYRYSETP